MKAHLIALRLISKKYIEFLYSAEEMIKKHGFAKALNMTRKLK